MKNPLQNLLAAVGQVMSPSPLRAELAPEWLAPVAPEHPSGPSLEYDAEFAVLAARLAPKAEVQYGQFKASAAEPDWKEIERDCRRLMLRSKDIHVLVWFARSRTRQAGAQGLLQGLSALQQVCEHFGQTVHPQLSIEGELDPLVRANALASLCDPEGLLEDVRDVVIVAASAHRLSVRDVERAMAVPRSAYAAEPQAVQRQLADLYQRRDAQLLALQACAGCVQFLQDWANVSLGDDAPQLQALIKLLQPLCGTAAQPMEANKVLAEAVDDAPQSGVGAVLASGPSESGHRAGPAGIDNAPAWGLPAPMVVAGASPLQNREQVRQALLQVRAWIEEHEPSSPVAVLLKQAERMWGKRFSEVAHMIPPELLQAWDQSE